MGLIDKGVAQIPSMQPISLFRSEREYLRESFNPFMHERGPKGHWYCMIASV